jgi:hypothetical protein
LIAFKVASRLLALATLITVASGSPASSRITTILNSPSVTSAFNSAGVADSAIASACHEAFAGIGSVALAGEIPRPEKIKVALD